jgi:hypothetical protein
VEHELPRRTVTAIQYEFIQEVRNLFAEPFAYNPENMYHPGQLCVVFL